MNDNLVSIKKLKDDIQSVKLLSSFLGHDGKKRIKDLEQQLQHMTNQFDKFINYFSDSGWCLYDSISSNIIESAINTFESEGMEVAENILLKYYMNDIKYSISRLKNKSSELMQRNELLELAFDDHFDGRFHSSVPMFLIIMDGAVNDFTKSKGFFAEGTDVSAWDCLVGCDESLSKMKKIFSKGRNKTNTDVIYIPYRNGILHGRDLNYANEYVSCKCVAMLFAIADWMGFKNSEEKRKEKLEKEMNPPPLSESIKKYKQTQIDKEEIKNWKAKKVIVGETINPKGSPEDYTAYPYLQPIFDLFKSWSNKNYGELSKILKPLFSYEPIESKRAGECRKLFDNKKFISFEFVEIEERGCSLSRINVQVAWSIGEKIYSESMEFGCNYQNEKGLSAFPWRGDGKWVLIPWNITGLYKV